ncbi:hypothetical protein [Aureivirga sp. CE67]|uniref:hypothetical protein n=1 Tax=Aureivirga sp. CE67 TaxID=1788983 RepID=UPI0018C95A35|nr:hypothetical protein [Aureivirga sp. CE67]
MRFLNKIKNTPLTPLKRGTFKFLILAVLFASCSKKEIKLPLIAEKGQEEILNHSQIWFFFEQKEQDTVVKLNKNNLIKSTNWVFNIDKRFTLKQIFSDLEKYKIKHFEEGMHEVKDSVGNYFSYANSVDNKLSFLNFTNTKYTNTKNSFEDLVNTRLDSSFYAIPVLIQKKGITLDRKSIAKEDFKNSIETEIEKNNTNKKIQISLFFDENVSYGDYLDIKAQTDKLKKVGVEINDTEYILE